MAAEHHSTTERAASRAWQLESPEAELLSSIVASTATGMAVVRGPDFVYDIVNPAFQGIAPGKRLLGRTVADVTPELAGQILPLLQAVLLTGEPYDVTDMPFELRRGASGRSAAATRSRRGA